MEVDVGLEEGDPIYAVPRRDQPSVSYVNKGVNFETRSRTHAVPTTKPTPPQVKASLMRETSSAADRLGRTTNDVDSMGGKERKLALLRSLEEFVFNT